MTIRESILPCVALLGAMLLWASSFIAMKVAVMAIDPLLVIFGRMALAALVFGLFIGRFKKLPLREHWCMLLVMALCEPCLYFIFEAYALQYTSASQAGIITATLPLMVALAAWMFLGEELGWVTIFGMIIAFIGVAGLSLGGEATQESPNPLFGNLLECMAMVCAAGYMVSVRYLSRFFPAFFLTAIQAFIGAVFFFPVLFFPNVTYPQWEGLLSFTPFWAVVYLGLVVTFLAYWLYNFGISRFRASVASSFVNLIPVFAVFFGWLLLNERLTLFQVGSCIVVFVGVFISSQRKTTHQHSSA